MKQEKRQFHIFIVALALFILILTINPIPVIAQRAVPSNANFIGDVSGLAINGQYAYVGDDVTLHTFDISDHNQPLIVDSDAVEFGVVGLEISGNRLYTYSRVWVNAFDISTPNNPVYLGRMATPLIDALAADGDYIYLGVDQPFSGSLLIVDFSNPAQPTEVDDYYLPIAAAPDGHKTIVKDLERIGDTLWIGYQYIIFDFRFYYGPYNGIVSVDVTNPTAHVIQQPYFDVGSFSALSSLNTDILYGAVDETIVVYNTQNLASPYPVATVDHTEGIVDLATGANNLYVVDRAGNFSVYTLSDLLSPQLTDTFPSAPSADFLAAIGTETFTINHEGDFQYYPLPLRQPPNIGDSGPQQNQTPWAWIEASPAAPTFAQFPVTVGLYGFGSIDFDGNIVAYAWDFDDGTTSTMRDPFPRHSYADPGEYTVSLTVTDDDGAQSTVEHQFTVLEDPCVDSHGLLFEWWDDIPGNLIGDLTMNAAYPVDPTGQDVLDSFEIPANVKDNYGVRLRGYIVPLQSGVYRFHMTSDDQGELWLSSSDDPVRAERIAYVNDWAQYDEWTKYLEQTSAEIELQAGQRYYVEALMKEYWGGDHLRVEWKRDDQRVYRPIPNEQLCALQLIGEAPSAEFTADPTGGTVPFTVNLDASASSDSDGSIVSYNWNFGDGSTGQNSTVSHTYPFPGVFEVELTITDNDGRIDVARQQIVVANTSIGCEETGLLQEWWTNIPGYKVSDLTSADQYPDQPSGSDIISDFATPLNRFDNYGVRVRGYLYPPVSGYYRFLISSDDNGELLFSSDDQSANATQIASVPGWTLPQHWSWYPEQTSQPIYLQAGEPYYIEALMKEWSGFDHLSIGWLVPNATSRIQVIPSAALCPFDAGIPPTALASATPTTGSAPLSVSFDGNQSFDPDGTLVNYEWAFDDGATATGVTATHTYNSVGTWQATLTVTDDQGRQATDEVTILVEDGDFVCQGNGVTQDWWHNQYSGNVADLLNDPRYPDLPQARGTLAQMIVPSNISDAYAQLLRAYLVAPESGLYRFYVASDNEGQLWLSNDVNPGNAVEIAQTDWSAEQDWAGTSGVSAEIALTGGEAYYIEGLHAASWGTDYYAVAWDTPSGDIKLIPNDALCVYEVIDGGRAASIV